MVRKFCRLRVTRTWRRGERVAAARADGLERADHAREEAVATAESVVGVGGVALEAHGQVVEADVEDLVEVAVEALAARAEEEPLFAGNRYDPRVVEQALDQERLTADERDAPHRAGREALRHGEPLLVESSSGSGRFMLQWAHLRLQASVTAQEAKAGEDARSTGRCMLAMLRASGMTAAERSRRVTPVVIGSARRRATMRERKRYHAPLARGKPGPRAAWKAMTARAR